MGGQGFVLTLHSKEAKTGKTQKQKMPNKKRANQCSVSCVPLGVFRRLSKLPGHGAWRKSPEPLSGLRPQASDRRLGKNETGGDSDSESAPLPAMDEPGDNLGIRRLDVTSGRLGTERSQEAGQAARRLQAILDMTRWRTLRSPAKSD